MVGRSRLEPPVPVPAGSKFCFKCQTLHLVDEFATDRAKWDRLRYCCRSCDVARWSAYAAQRPKRATILSRRRANWLTAKARLETALIDGQGAPND